MKKKTILVLILIAIICPLNVYAACPLGPDVTKDLHGLLKAFNIVAPIMCIVYSIYEFIKSLTHGDAAGDFKKVATRFGKRVLYTILLIFLPILVNQFMIIADVWGVDGTCNLATPTENGTDSSSSSTGSSSGTNSNYKSPEEIFGAYRTPRCAAYDLDATACFNAGCGFVQGYCIEKTT